MKSDKALIGISLLFLLLAVSVSTIIWNDISSPVKIGMFVLGFGGGVSIGSLITTRRGKNVIN